MIGTVVIHPQKQEREKIALILARDDDIEVLANGKDGYDALKLVGNLKPDIAIMDGHLELINGEGVPHLLKIRSPSTAVVIIVEKISDYQLCRAAANEVTGIVSKSSDLEKFPEVLKAISRGHGFLSPVLTPRVFKLLSSSIALEHSMTHGKTRLKEQENTKFLLFSEDLKDYLSKTELKVLSQVGEGYNSGEIAKNLDLAVGTVRNCISSIMHKTGLGNRTQMVRYAFTCGFLSKK